MDKVLDFLANNYIYFLIGAGVLFFALIGFIVDLKKKNKLEEGNGEVAPEVPIDTQVPVTPVVPVAPVTVEPVAQVEIPVTPVEEYRPIPPMPAAAPEVVNVVPTPMEQVQTPAAPVQAPVQAEPKIEIEEL